MKKILFVTRFNANRSKSAVRWKRCSLINPYRISPMTKNDPASRHFRRRRVFINGSWIPSERSELGLRPEHGWSWRSYSHSEFLGPGDHIYRTGAFFSRASRPPLLLSGRVTHRPNAWNLAHKSESGNGGGCKCLACADRQTDRPTQPSILQEIPHVAAAGIMRARAQFPVLSLSLALSL